MGILKTSLLGLAVALGLSVQAEAANLMNTVFSLPQVFSATTPLKIFPSGSFFQSFFTTKAETVMISFSAVCSTTGTSNQGTAIQILIDSKVIYPTNAQSNVFCPASGSNNVTIGTATYTLVTAVRVTAGNHNVQVNGVPLNGGTSRIDDLVMLVWE